MYKQVKDHITGEPVNNLVLRVSDNAFIPLDLGNKDYREYLSWLEAGNTLMEDS